MGTQEQKTILLVDDDVLIAHSQAMILKKEGYHVITSHSGKAAIEKTGSTSIDLILMDIDMGKDKMDGTEAASIILQDHDIPVVFLSSHTEPEIVAKTEKITSYGYIVKGSADTVLFASVKMAFKLHKAHRELKEQEEKYRSLVECLPDIVMRFDRDGRHLFVSENVSEVVDFQAAQFIGKTHRELGFPEEQCRFWEEAIRRVFENGTPFETEYSFESKEGSAIHNWRLMHERDAQGSARSVLSLSRDITAHRKAEQDYQILFHEMLDGFSLHEIICDGQGNPADYRFLAVNPAFERMTGLKADNIVGRTVLEVLPGIERYWIATYGRVALTGEPAFFENYSKDLAKYFEVKTFRPAPNQFACIFYDITDRKQFEDALKKTRQQLRFIMNSVPALIWQKDMEGRYLQVNKAYCETVGISEGDIIGKTDHQIWPESIARKYSLDDAEVMESRIDRRGIEEKHIKSSGDIGWSLTDKMVWYDREQNIGGTIGFALDITERKESELIHLATIELLHMINTTSSKEQLIKSVTTFLKQWLHCDAIGIRLKDGDDFPYYETSGFPEEFVQAERHLCSYDAKGEVIRDSTGSPVLDCMCGNILCGRFDPAKDFFTPHGSFWSNCTTELLASTTEEDRQARTRNRCNGEGYESVGLFPLRLGSETFGLLQVNDKQKGLFTLRMLSSLEWFGDNLAIALARLRAEEELRESEERFQTLATLAPVGVYLTDPDGNCLYTNTAWCRMAGLSPEDALGQGWIKGLHPDDRAFVFSSWQQMVESQGEWCMEYRFQTRKGIVTTVYGLAVPQYDVSGKIIRYIGVNLDITDRKLAEEALREKGEILSATQRLAKVGGWQWDVETQTMSWTEEAYRIHDLEEDGFIPGSPEHIDRSLECYMPEHRPLIMAAFKNCVEHGQSYDLEFPFVTFKGRRLWIRTVAQAILHKGRIVKVMGNIMDITDRKSAEDNIYALLSEKELLLREVHHRIKNNMNVIISLLSLQSSTLKDPSAISSLEDARNRVRSMMVLYDKLYQSPNFREVSVKEYLTSLIDEIRDNLLKHESVTIEKQIDDLILDAKTLSSVGIILNELLSNAMKHAFIGRDNGTIWVSFSLKDNHAVLVVQDNGTGIPESFDIATSAGFGMQLVGILTEQLEGAIQVERGNGMRFVMEFDV
jgi:PAS domain S-box-containing protein